MKQLNWQLEVTLILSLPEGQRDEATFPSEHTEPPPSQQAPLLPNLNCSGCIIATNQSRVKARLETG